MDDGTPVSQIMRADVLTTTPDARAEEAARLLREHHVSGLPVVDEEGRVVGVLTQTDLVRDLHAAQGVNSARGLLDLLLDSAPNVGESLLEMCRHRLRRARVRDLMSAPAVTVPRTASVKEAARRMRTHGRNRLPVVDARERLVGIVTRRDLLAALSATPVRARGALRPSPPRAPPARSTADPYADA